MEIISGNKNYVVSFTDVSQSLIHLPYLTVYQKTTTEYEKTLVRLWFVLGLLPEIDREDSIENNLKNRAILVKGTKKRKTPFMYETQMACKLWNDCIMY